MRTIAANRRNRLERERKLFEHARGEFQKLKHDPLFLIGIALYWAEGAKRSFTFQFMNSDPNMINFMILWCRKFIYEVEDNIFLRLYLHKIYSNERCEEYWSKVTGLSLSRFKRTIYKPTSLGIKKRPMYKGCMRIEIAKGKNLVRKMQFWQKLLVSEFRQVVV